MQSFHLADLHSTVKLYSTDCVSQCLLFPLSQGALLQEIEIKFCYVPFFSMCACCTMQAEICSLLSCSPDLVYKIETK